jgi:uncharacterized membrane protein
MDTNKHQKSTAVSSVESGYNTRQTIVNYFLVLMFTIFPLFFTNGYFNIRHDKYNLFLGLSLVLMIAEGALLAYVVFGGVQSKGKNASIDQVKWYEKLNFPDFAMLALLLFCLISTALSSYPLDALLGTKGRNSGLLLIAVYVGVYFVITRCFYYKEYIFAALAAGASVVFLLAVLNCFYIDLLGMYDGISDEQTLTDFTSTIGNKNLLSSFICIVLPVMMSIAVLTEKKALRALYLLASGLGFAALMTSDSDSGILGMGVFAVVYFICFSRKISRLKRYFLTLTVMLLFAKLLRLFSFIMGDNSKGMDSFQEFFVYTNAGYVLLAVCAVITALLYFLDFKKPDITLSKAVPIAFGAAAILAVLGIIGAVVYFSAIDTTTDLGSLEQVLRFNDKWGTHRGYMWIRSMWIFADESILGKLFGCGPDTFYYAFSPYFKGLEQYGDSSTNAAHNEYINYLITIGIAGTAAYLAVVGSVIARAVKAAKRNPLAIVCVSAVICYSVQAVVNISQPITTPLFIIFLALTEAVNNYQLTMNN